MTKEEFITDKWDEITDAFEFADHYRPLDFQYLDYTKSALFGGTIVRPQSYGLISTIKITREEYELEKTIRKTRVWKAMYGED